MKTNKGLITLSEYEGKQVGLRYLELFRRRSRFCWMFCELLHRYAYWVCQDGFSPLQLHTLHLGTTRLLLLLDFFREEAFVVWQTRNTYLVAHIWIEHHNKTTAYICAGELPNHSHEVRIFQQCQPFLGHFGCSYSTELLAHQAVQSHTKVGYVE